MTTNVKGKAMTPGVKGKTKATAPKGETKATKLKEFLSNLATDARKLGEFLHDPEAAMSVGKLSEADKTALRSGVSGMVAARLAGMPLDQAFQPPPQLPHIGPPPAWHIGQPATWHIGLPPQLPSLPQFVVYYVVVYYPQQGTP